MPIAQNVIELIGCTPMVKLKSLDTSGCEIFAKLEAFNPGGSVKDRVALGIIEDAEKSGLLRPGSIIVEATSGNTGVGLAMVAAVKGYGLIVVMPESMSQERQELIRAYGAELVLTPAREGMEGSVKVAQQLAKRPNHFSAGQFTNPANPEIHRKTTAKEIIEQTGGKLDALVVGIGTGGTITGIGEVLKAAIPDLLIVGVEPAGSPVLSGGVEGPHMLQGIGAGFVPKVLNRAILERIIQVEDHDAYLTMVGLAQQEGLLIGISSGAAAFAAGLVARELGHSKRVVTIFPDTGERYLSMHPYFKLLLRSKGIRMRPDKD